MQALGYILIFWQPPFPLFLVAFIFNGFGLGLQVRKDLYQLTLQNAQVISLISRYPGPNTKMSVLSAMYGVGATVSPLVSTEFVKQVSRVTYYYTVSLGLALLTLVAFILVFRFRTEDQIFVRNPAEDTQVDNLGYHEPPQSSSKKMSRIMRNPAVHFLAFYMAIYVSRMQTGAKLIS